MKAKSCFGILFILSIIAGIILGKMITDGGIEPTPTPTPPQEIIPEVNDTILFIGVNSLEAETPLLEGAWLATLSMNNNHDDNIIQILLITLYPILPEHVNSLEKAYLAEPHAPIQIDPNHLEKFREIKPIFDTDQEWTHIIVVDEYAMNLIISLTNPNLSLPIPAPSPNTFIKSWENPVGAYQQHRAIIKTLCEEPENFALYNTILEIVNLNNSHLKTNLTKEGLIQIWQLVNYSVGKNVECKPFP
ncbi:MAG: hypothetical protein GWN14_08730 [candidate division Zixibacteria bacterium]|nr:hypothetical protein [Gammaproteobacteria bacterium]NIX55995.1 hypothetical protein [candidate division Zixibacteria bacterium]